MTPPDPEPEPIDIRSIRDDEQMVRPLVSALITHLNQSADARIQVTPANVTLWHDVLAPATFGEALTAAHGYYRKYDPKNPDRPPLGIGTLGHLIQERLEYEERLRAHQLPPAKIDKRKMPRRVLLKFQAAGKLLDRNPDDYPHR